MTRRFLFTTLLLCAASFPARAQVTERRLTNAAQEPQNWLTYSGTYFGQRYSMLNQITPANAKNLELKWMHQTRVAGTWQATPLVVDGVMYITQRFNDVVALDAKTGRVFWTYQYQAAPDHKACCGANNRGLAILGDTLFMGTVDAYLVAIDAKDGRPLWKTQVGDIKLAHSLTMAPLVAKDKVIVGIGGGELGIRGFIAAYDVKTGKEIWRFYTIPGPGEAGHETWEPCPPNPTEYCDPDAWKHGGASVWLTGSYDPALNLAYWGIGNAGPSHNPSQRPGDNLYTVSVVALNVDTGKLAWHYQFIPNEKYDFDATQVPVLADIDWNGQPLKAMFFANRNGVYYVFDRATGRFLLGKPFAKVNWLSGFDERGRPIQTPQPFDQVTWPGTQGATNWYSPSYSPRTGLFYIPTWENYANHVGGVPTKYEQGRNFGGCCTKPHGPVPGAPGVPSIQRGPINFWTESAGTGAVLAIDARTGDQKWKYTMTDVTDSGILTTASDVLFTGSREGHFHAINARTGELLWRSSLGSQIVNGPMTYQVDGKQYVATIAGHALVVFGLRD